MNHSEQINELGTALAKAQGQIDGAKKDSANPFFKSKYADLASVWEACRLQLSSNGLSVTQCPEESENGIAIETMLLHSSGQWVKSRYTMPVSKMDAQAVGSAITYARRYALAAIVGIAPEDDDGNSAAKAKPEEKPKTKSDHLPEYPAEQFAENTAGWVARINAKKQTADQVINMIATKYTLSDVQKQSIRNMERENEDA